MIQGRPEALKFAGILLMELPSTPQDLPLTLTSLTWQQQGLVSSVMMNSHSTSQPVWVELIRTSSLITLSLLQASLSQLPFQQLLPTMTSKVMKETLLLTKVLMDSAQRLTAVTSSQSVDQVHLRDQLQELELTFRVDS